MNRNYKFKYINIKYLFSIQGVDLIVVFIGGPIYFWRRQSQRAAPRPRHAPHCALCRREGPVSNGRRGREKIGPPTSVCLSVRPLSVRPGPAQIDIWP